MTIEEHIEEALDAAGHDTNELAQALFNALGAEEFTDMIEQMAELQERAA